MLQSLFACCLLYLVELLLIKVSILMFYRRIFGMNWMIWGCLIISGCWCIGSMIAALCACQPVSYFWNELTDPTSGRYRYNFYYYYIGNGTANMVTDVLILLVPMPIIWRLQIRTGQKIGVCSILLLGGLYDIIFSLTLPDSNANMILLISVCVASIVRIYYITFLDGNMDLTWALSDVNVWSTVEPCIGIICACLPALQPLIRLIAKRIPSKQHFGAGRRTATIQRPRPFSRHTKSRKSSIHEVWHGQQQDCDSSMKPFFRSGEDQMRLNTITTRVEMEQDSKQRDSLEERLDPMAIRVKRVVHWSVD